MSGSPKAQRRAVKAKRLPVMTPPDDALLRTVFHNSPAVQSIIRFPEAVLVEINERFSKVLGYTREEVIGKTPFELNFWVSPEKLSAYRSQLESQGAVRDFEMDVRAKDGSIRTVLLSSDLIEIDGVRHSITAGVDITARKQAEAELQLAHEKLRQSEERFSKAFRSSPAMMAITRLA